jgi:hypothetical protein
MKKFLFLSTLWLAFSLHVNAQVKKDTLTNAKIIQLSSLGLQPNAIITKIQNSNSRFDVSVDGLVALKNAGVDGLVISEMINAQAKTETAFANRKDPNDPKTMRPTGIYYFNPKDTLHYFTTIDPTVVSSTETGGAGSTIAQSMTYGLAKSKDKSSLSGEESRRKIKDTVPVFYFYFDTIAQGNNANWWFSSSTSPNEFALVKLRKTKNTREMTVGKSNAYGQSSGIDEKQKIAFTYEAISPGVYKIVPAKALESGEYCFVYTGATPTIYSNNKVFDFSIP